MVTFIGEWCGGSRAQASGRPYYGTGIAAIQRFSRKTDHDSCSEWFGSRDHLA